MYVYSCCCCCYGRTAGRSGVRISSVLLRLHDCGQFHTRASVLQMVTLGEVENHRSSARRSEVLKIPSIASERPLVLTRD